VLPPPPPPQAARVSTTAITAVVFNWRRMDQPSSATTITDLAGTEKVSLPPLALAL
jgi:hypothetical protein